TGPLIVSGGSGNDAVTIDLSSGNPIPTGGVNFDGNTGSNTLTVGAAITTAATYTGAIVPNAGSLQLAGAVTGTINYSGVPAVIDNVIAADRAFNFTGSAKTVAVTDAGGGTLKVDSTSGQLVTFPTPDGSLSINSGAGDDTINITSLDPAFHGGLAVLGGDGSDTIHLNTSLTVSANHDLIVAAETVTVPAGIVFATSGTGDIAITADSLAVALTASFTSESSVTLTPATLGTPVNLGAAGAAGTLGLTDAVLDRFTTPSLVIGDAGSGALTVSAAISRSSATTLALNSGGAITLNAGINTNGGNVTLDGTSVSPVATGVDVSMGASSILDFGPGTNVALAIGGSTADTTYGQLNVAGHVNLSGANLTLSGAYVPQPTDVFVLVNNDGTDPISGIFNGLVEGTTFAFNGKILAIHYSGGSGNDVVLSVPAPPGSVTPPPNGIYTQSQVISITVNFNKAVFVTGTPQMNLDIGGFPRSASYVSGSGTSALVFSYVVATGDSDSDGIALLSPLSLNGGTIVDSLSDSVPLSFTPPNTTGVLIDGRVLFTSGTSPAPGPVAGGSSVGTWGSIRSGMAIASSGALAFRGYLNLSATVTANDFQGIWKTPDGTGASATQVARSGNAAPDVPGGMFDVLPFNPVINSLARTSFVGFLRVGMGGVNTSNDSGIWSELGGSGLHLVLREGDALAGGIVKAAAPSGWVATSENGKAAFNVRLSNGSALVRASLAGGTATLVTLATEGGTAPGGGTFDTFVGNSNDARMNSGGDVAFLSYLQAGGSGLWYQSAAGSLGTVVRSGGTAPGLAETFLSFERPTLGTGIIAFRAFLSVHGQSVWKGNPTTPGSIAIIGKTGDTTFPGMPAGSKLWSIWSPFSNASGKVAFRVSVLDASSVETRAIVTDSDGTAKIIAKAGDSAPGSGGQKFVSFDHPVIGDGNHTAFIASTTGGTVGLWRQSGGGGPIELLLRVGDTIPGASGSEVISTITIPGTATADRLNEQRCVDATGRVLVHVSYNSGNTGMLMAAP
ncbi:MAG: hypothetical protein JWO94_1682, partial [Verrucomicrobiaceae bacterium]|nr:hypothetical protein [Verrucomicrobiaceae bacterium]